MNDLSVNSNVPQDSAVRGALPALVRPPDDALKLTVDSGAGPEGDSLPCAHAQLRRDSLEVDVFAPCSASSHSQCTRVDAANRSEEDAVGTPLSSGPSVSAAPLSLVERYLHFLASGGAFASGLADRTNSQEAISDSTNAITESVSYLALSGSRASSTAASSPKAALPPTAVDAVRNAPYLVEPVFIQASTVDLLLTRLANDVATLRAEHSHEVAMRVLEDSSPSVSPKTASVEALSASLSIPLQMPYHTSIPQRLDLPLKERCPLCQKLDSLCSRCHAKWAGVQRTIREINVKPAYEALPPIKRTSLAFLSAAFGEGALLTAQLFHDASVVALVRSPYRVVALGETWRSTLAGKAARSRPLVASTGVAGTPQTPAVEDAVLSWLRERFLRAGAVHALHVALAHRNTATTTALLADPNVRFLSSSSSSSPSASSLVTGGGDGDADPLSFLLCTSSAGASAAVPPALLRALNSSQECRQHIRSELAKVALREHHYVDAKSLLDDLRGENPDDERGLWLSAVLNFAESRYDSSQRDLQRLLHTASQQPLLFLDRGRILRLLVQMDKRTPSTASASSSFDYARVPVRLRRLPFSVVRNDILPFCAPLTLMRVHEATTMPLLRATTVAVAARSPLPLLHRVLTDDTAHYGELVLALIDELPQTEPPAEAERVHVTDRAISTPSSTLGDGEADDTVEPPAPKPPSALVTDGTLRPLNVHVLSLTSFCTLVIKLSMAGKRSRAFTAFLHTQDTASSLFDQFLGDPSPASTCLRTPEIVMSRVFTVQRSAVGAPWHAVPYTSWELDLAGTAQLSLA